MKRLIARSLMVVLCAGVAYPAAAQTGAKEEAKKAGEQTKEAGKEAGSAAKHAGKATAKATKKTGKAVKNVVTGDKRCGISRAQAREVIRFVRSIPGVSHQIITIDALDVPQVIVTTGEPLERGHTIFLRRVGRRWTVEKTLPWTKKDWIILGGSKV